MKNWMEKIQDMVFADDDQPVESLTEQDVADMIEDLDVTVTTIELTPEQAEELEQLHDLYAARKGTLH